MRKWEILKNEIDKDFYCSAGYELCGGDYNSQDTCKKCNAFHRKWPTPEQFKEEYGEEYPGDGAVYFLEEDDNSQWWEVRIYKEIKEMKKMKFLADSKGVIIGFSKIIAVCACTPWGVPPSNWRPE